MKTLALAALLAVVPLCAHARPFRAMVTRTAETTSPANLELGLRYQGFYAGSDLDAQPYHQLSPGVRFGLVPNVELNLYLDIMLLGIPGVGAVSAYVGDIPLGVQFTFLETQQLALGVWIRGTIPVGASTFERLPTSLQDRIPPTVSDGTWDAEGTFIAEMRPNRDFRVMLNLGYLFNGARNRTPAQDDDFDVPEAIRWDIAATFNLSEDFLLGVEVMGRSYLASQVTPTWDNNQHQVEVIPHARLEIIPNLVLEAALGIAVTRDLSEIYRFRGLLGFTYEFDLLGRRDGGDRDDKRERSRGRKRGRK